ncbi:MAG: lytic murein transglycosylase [Candidatus Marinimicrobia bacterium]|nr:lytic murein transglycosylase [Candidatus Neomarinimicrobiota bacterium]
MIRFDKILFFQKRFWLYGAILVMTAIFLHASFDFVQYRLSEYRLNKYGELIADMENRGFERAELIPIFSDTRVEFYPKISIKEFALPELNDTSGFIHEKTRGYNTQRFLEKYKKYLELAEKRYSVEREAIVAILTMETNLGKDIGKYSVFNVLSSMSLAGDKKSQYAIVKFVEKKYRRLPEDQRNQIVKRLQQRAEVRSVWAKNELAILIQLYLEDHLDILSLPGSHAGAFGYPQFLPSSAKSYGIDANKDGTVDLYNFPDAIMSVANFLNKKGWDKDLQNQKDALRSYNNNHQYVLNVISTTDSIKTSSGTEFDN